MGHGCMSWVVYCIISEKRISTRGKNTQSYTSIISTITIHFTLNYIHYKDNILFSTITVTAVNEERAK